VGYIQYEGFLGIQRVLLSTKKGYGGTGDPNLSQSTTCYIHVGKGQRDGRLEGRKGRKDGKAGSDTTQRIGYTN
jgi:hypothetical protein